MRFYTFDEINNYALKARSKSQYYSFDNILNETIQEQQNRNSFDIFLSHSSKDKQLILGVKQFIEDSGYSVYIDWVDDPQLDRANVNVQTADVLRTRMKQSKFLLYVDSNNATASKWMPWELGYFDGYKPNKIGILPIRQNPEGYYTGQEYLGLYPKIEKNSLNVLNEFKYAEINGSLFTTYFTKTSGVSLR
ncbi:MAG TPA: toll/interleukin-1 receptor domain-containing protein [Globicatella sulfidifaciens]|uniref:toll/interleukin-1 receptor domain-containing protein n=1 Tax=Acinetobacter sp. 10FS3-1 TaxID=2563897 RepID=UPI00157D27BC|nr:toll/interleukin-1 receptor domain-containing protein [Acinetobacter sp. 10FS3-1]MDM1781898.1 toll/interleukin-1 receptor domain-containing protein [Acinetobacter indicus]QKQ70474.1 toll/interleukin-1 receptor domain-containing protein [Acinetobacter sp. 10FS3-1]HJF16088.1 toll/interleukin-1 receptor domain-containing protein [Globicatella sulfidifaciens]